MLSKILLTVGVIVIVLLVYRTKTSSRRPPEIENPAAQSSLSVRAVAIVIIVMLVFTSSAVFYFKYQSDNRIVTIRVISEDGTGTVYQAKQKAIKGRNFKTLDNRSITLGESDRIEMDGL